MIPNGTRDEGAGVLGRFVHPASAQIGMTDPPDGVMCRSHSAGSRSPGMSSTVEKTAGSAMLRHVHGSHSNDSTASKCCEGLCTHPMPPDSNSACVPASSATGDGNTVVGVPIGDGRLDDRKCSA